MEMDITLSGAGTIANKIDIEIEGCYVDERAIYLT